MLEAGALLVPLDEVAPGETTSVELIYAGPVSHAWLFSREVFPGPKFNLPLADIAWSLYLPPSRRYYGFGGTLQFEGELGLSAGRVFDAESYAEKAEREGAHSLQLAEDVLKQGERFAREGKQRAAKKAFEAAMNYSIGQEDFNEDARIQYRNLAKQQAIVGLVNRRADLKRSWNVHEETSKPMEGGDRRGGVDAGIRSAGGTILVLEGQ